ncbi:hypothetical protein NKG99_20590 [Mesorhizobium sp. M1409]|uniref:hypothetical protein n=1 Tax=Mesorhizobium sp. M1409 TaxID=2957100 RepID=UPI003337A21E
MEDVQAQVREEVELPLGIPQHQAGETKEEAFERIAPKRVAHALNAIRLIGNLSNRSAYAYRDQDIVDVMAVLRQALTDVESRFRVNSPTTEFQLRR